jgi:hypothetical protein
MLVSDSIKRAHEQGLPIILTALQQGQMLYFTLGFVVKDLPVLTTAKIDMPIMVWEPSSNK